MIPVTLFILQHKAATAVSDCRVLFQARSVPDIHHLGYLCQLQREVSHQQLQSASAVLPVCHLPEC